MVELYADVVGGTTICAWFDGRRIRHLAQSASLEERLNESKGTLIDIVGLTDDGDAGLQHDLVFGELCGFVGIVRVSDPDSAVAVTLSVASP